MFTFLSRTLLRTVVLGGVVFFGTSAIVAQVPQSTPRPTPPQGDPTRPPGQEPIPGSPLPQNPTAPPGPVRTSPTAVPGATPVPAATPVPQQPAGTVPGGETQEPIREPNIPQFQPRPLPPIPSLNRLGVGSETLTLSLNDAIKRALENNNDIEVARDDVRYAETQLRALEGIFDPIFSITPTIDKRVIPVQNIFAGGGTAGQLSNTTLTLSPTINKQFGRGGGNYQFQFSNSRTKTTATNSTLNPYYSSNLSLAFTQPLWRNRPIDNLIKIIPLR